MIEDSDGVVKGHGLDVERSKDCLLVCQGRVVVGGHLSVEDLLVLIHKEWLQMIIPKPTSSRKYQKVSESSKKVPNHLGGEYHTHITQIDIDCPQICPAQRRTLFKVFKFSRINNSN